MSMSDYIKRELDRKSRKSTIKEIGARSRGAQRRLDHDHAGRRRYHPRSSRRLMPVVDASVLVELLSDGERRRRSKSDLTPRNTRCGRRI